MRDSSYQKLRTRVNTKRVNRKRKNKAIYMMDAFPSVYVLKEKEGNDDKIYLKKYYISRHRNSAKSFLKKEATRRYRRNKKYSRKGNVYKKEFDLWWELY